MRCKNLWHVPFWHHQLKRVPRQEQAHASICALRREQGGNCPLDTVQTLQELFLLFPDACSWASGCLWLLFLYFKHKSFTVFCWINDNELQSRSLLTRTLSLVAILISIVWMPRSLSPLIRRDTVPEPWLPTVPSTEPRDPTCLRPPWLRGMFCAGCCPSCPSPAGRRSKAKPEFTVLTAGGKQAEHKPQSPPRVTVIKQSNEFSVREPKAQPRCRSFHALRKGGNRPRKIFPSKVKESVPLPSQHEQEGGEDNSANGTGCHRKVLHQNLAMLSHSYTLPEPNAMAGSGCHAEWLFYWSLWIYLKAKLLSAYNKIFITTLCIRWYWPQFLSPHGKKHV